MCKRLSSQFHDKLVGVGIDAIQVPFGSTEGVVSTGVESSSERKEAGWLVAMDYIIWGKLMV